MGLNSSTVIYIVSADIHHQGTKGVQGGDSQVNFDLAREYKRRKLGK